MNLAQLVSDPYNRRARLQPALLAILPIALSALVMYPELESQAIMLVGTVGYFGGAMWLTQLGRGRGKKLEPELYDAWGGKPSVVFLRHSDTTISNATKHRYHAFLSTHVLCFRALTQEQEDNDLTGADEAYQSATDWLLANTRNANSFRLIFEENVNYGFRRNFWALKPVAITVDVGLLLLILLWLYIRYGSDDPVSDIRIFLAYTAISVHLIAVLVVVTKDWVRMTANSYASQLLAACDSLTINSKETG